MPLRNSRLGKAAVVGAAVSPARRRSPRPPSSAPRFEARARPDRQDRRRRRGRHPGSPPLLGRRRQAPVAPATNKPIETPRRPSSGEAFRLSGRDFVRRWNRMGLAWTLGSECGDPRCTGRGVPNAGVIERAKAGDHEAFSELGRLWVDRLYAIACLILRDPERATDATQEALIACWRDLRGLRDPDLFGSWIRRILVNACYREARRTQSRQRLERRVVFSTSVTPTRRPRSRTATSSNEASCCWRPISERSSPCTTTSACPSRRRPMRSDFQSGPSSPGFTGPCRSCARTWPPRHGPRHSPTRGPCDVRQLRLRPDDLARFGLAVTRAGGPAAGGARPDGADGQRPSLLVAERWTTVQSTLSTTRVTRRAVALLIVALVALAIVAGLLVEEWAARPGLPSRSR